ncbi:MAG: DUF2029 domain-containing protein [Candidatus Wallbacteria bacterium]|nr:DUF2029 domain-containing protein [Candidatus Wallbacteria bacterium]
MAADSPSGEKVIAQRTGFFARSGLSQAMVLVFALYCAATLWIVATDREDYQWDFRTYYLAGKAFAAGDDPYVLKSLQKHSEPNRVVDKPFLYPPLTLHLFAAVAKLSPAQAYEIWLAVKLAMLCGLLWLWHRDLTPLRPAVLTVPFMLLAFNAALFWDLEAGNVTIQEQFLIWLGFAFLLRGGLWRFAICIALAAQFKLLPQLLSVALLLLEPRRGLRPFLASWGLFGIGLGAGTALYPGYTREFFSAAAGLDELGHTNPCLRALVGDLLLQAHLPAGLATAIYALMVIVIGAAAIRVLDRRRSEDGSRDNRFVWAYLCLTFALAAPRFKSYAYIQVLGPALYFLRLPVPPGYMALDLALAGALFPNAFNPMPGRALIDLVQNYSPWLGVLLLWLRANASARMGVETAPAIVD